MNINFYELHDSLSFTQRYSLAIAIFFTALALRFLILPIESGFNFITFYPAVLLTFYICGSKPGYLLIFLSAFCGYFIFSPPFWTLSPDFRTILAVGFYSISSLFMGLIVNKGHYWYEQSTRKTRESNNKQIDSMDERLNHAHALLEMAELYADAGAWNWNFVTDKVYCSKHFFELFGLVSDVSEIHPDMLRKIIHPDDIKGLDKNMRNAILLHSRLATTFRIVLSSGTIKWIDAYGSPVYDEFDKPIEFMGVAVNSTTIHQARDDILKLQTGLDLQVAIRTSDLIEANKKLEYLSRHDGLTGLSNRLAANERLRIEFLSMKRTRHYYAVLMLDIDFFKAVNDTYGHAFGDEVLRRVAKVLQDQIRESDFLARFGGEEFIILLPNTELEIALLVAEKIRIKIETMLHPVAGKVTVSIGVAISKSDQTTENVAVEESDKWLYSAKNAGRNCVMPNFAK